jgi:hypothetical protein
MRSVVPVVAPGVHALVVFSDSAVAVVYRPDQDVAVTLADFVIVPFFSHATTIPQGGIPVKRVAAL